MRKLLLSAILLAAYPAVSLAQEAGAAQAAETQFTQEALPVQGTETVRGAGTAQETQSVQATPAQETQPAIPVQQTLPAQGGAQFAQDALPAVRQRTPFVKQHELRLTAGAYPVLLFINWVGCDGGRDYFYDMYYKCNRTYRGAEYTSGAWSLSYDYRFKKWFDLGVVFSYYGIYSKSYDVESEAIVGRNRAHYLTVMPMVRFTWLNREWVRMYSSLGFGATFGFGQEDYNDGRFDRAAFALQLTPIGISVGRSFFGFAEIGVGAQGALMMGVGYKFKPKNNSVK